MSRKCYFCSKRPRSGNSVSHSNRKTKRLFNPNLQFIRIMVKGKALKEYVCTKCIKAGKAVKAV